MQAPPLQVSLYPMASIAGLYGGLGTNQEDGSGGRVSLLAKFKRDLIKEQASQAAQRREE